MPKHTIRIALLLNDTPLPAVVAESGTYYDVYKTWLQSSLSTYPDSSISSQVELVIDGYDVVDKREYPFEDRLKSGSPDAYDCIMMTGSRHTAYDSSNPFIPPLVEFIRRIATSPEHLHLKLIGVCFGHQIISLALGGDCVTGTNGWEIGVYGCELTPEGRYWWTGDVEGQGGDNKIYLEQMHRDHVPSLPPGCQLLARSSKYPVHSMVKLHPDSTEAKPLAQILTVQGHPEFTPSIVSHIVDSRSELGVFDDEATAEARRRLGGKDGTGGEGFGRIGWAVWRVLLQGVV
ncbi:hypothetical protein IAT38_008298 [Cryptococcus sp. DSM 104549]